MIEATTKLVMRMHREAPTGCWADSVDLPGYTAAGKDFAEVMSLVGEALDEATLLGLTPRQILDVRWQWCDDPSRSVTAVDPDVGWGIQRPTSCPCAENG